MKRRRVLFIQLSQFRLFMRRLVVALVVLSAFFLIVLRKANNAHLNTTEDIASKILNPVIRTMQLPADGVYFVYKKIKDIVFVYNQNERLKKDLQDFDLLYDKLYTLEIENEVLAEMLHYKLPDDVKFFTAKVIAIQGDGFSHSLIVHLADNQTAKKGQIVLHKKNVIGRVESVSDSYARIMPITDINSKIPVFIKQTKTRAILAGNNTTTMDLLYSSSGIRLKVGDEILTSGIGGIFPTGLPIGYISEVSEDTIKVKPFDLIKNIEYVRIADYGIPDYSAIKEDMAP